MDSSTYDISVSGHFGKRIFRKADISVNVRIAGVEGNWRGKAHDRREWRRLVRKTTVKLRSPPSPLNKGMHAEEDYIASLGELVQPKLH